MSGRVSYGMQFPEGTSDLDVELWCYAHDRRPENTGGRLTVYEHFKNCIDLLWNVEDSTRRVIHNEWTERMHRALIANRYTGLAGSGSSGKSDAVAVWMLIEWLAAPADTLCLILSTTLDGARKRIWKSVNELWGALEARWEKAGVTPVGRMIDSKGALAGMDANGKYSMALGLSLVAADKDNEANAAKKLKGLKAPAEGRGRLRMAADEFSDLGESVLTAMLGNLNTNPDFKACGMSNPGSKLTPFGRFVEPKGGWKTLRLDVDEWETKYGICLRFDAERSPRILTPELEHPPEKPGEAGWHELYNWMPSQQSIDQMAEAFGKDSMEYWAQVRGMFCPTGREKTIWSEAELLLAGEKVDQREWDFGKPLTMIMANDPAFTNGGDRAPLGWAICGTIKGRKVMEFQDYEILTEGLKEDEDASTQLSVCEKMIEDFKMRASLLKVSPSNCGYDNTGGGIVYGQWITSKWSGALVQVNFGGKPMERRADGIQEQDIYGDRVAQLWVQPKGLVRQGQIRGIPHEIIEEICMRQNDLDKVAGGKVWIESKKKMKKRTGRSPDLADMFFILVEVAIQRGLLDIIEIRKTDAREQQKFKESIQRVMPVFGGQNSIVARPSFKRLKTRS